MLYLYPLQIEDSAAAALLHKKAFYSSWSEETFQNLIAENNIYGKKVIFEESIKGIIIGRILEDEAEILTFIVEEKFQKKGFGTLLFEAFLEDLKKASIKKLFLEVAEDNDSARRFYYKNSFKSIGKRPNYYRKGPQKFVNALNLELNIFEQKRF